MESMEKEANTNLELRRDKLRAMLKQEEDQYVSEVMAEEETMLERQARYRNRAKELKEKKEQERCEFVKSKNDEIWMANCDALRGVMSKRMAERTDVNRAWQVRVKEKRRKEEKDIDEAYPALFQGRPCILTAGDRRDEEAVKKIREVWEAAGSKVQEMDPEVHDRLFAVLEDLPILFLNLVCKAAGQVSGYVDEIDDYSSQELKEITRLVSKVSPHAAERLWANRTPLVHVLAYYRLKLKELSEALQEGSFQDLKALF